MIWLTFRMNQFEKNDLVVVGVFFSLFLDIDGQSPTAEGSSHQLMAIFIQSDMTAFSVFRYAILMSKCNH